MRPTLPNEVVSVIDRFYSWAAAGSQNFIRLSDSECAALIAIVELSENIPAHLIVLHGEDLAAYLCSTAAIRDSAQAFRTNPKKDIAVINLESLAQFDNRSPITVLRACLSKCPNSLPAPGTADLPFFTDQALREALRIELSDAEQALVDKEWRAATILGGATLEAILFWSFKGLPLELAALASKPSGPIEDWKLRPMIVVARQIGIIEEPTKKLAELARDARNLVHPGQVLKSRANCDKATSQTVLAAIEAVVRDISSFCQKQGRRL